MDDKIKKISLSLHEIGAIKFGEFKLKSGILSPIYVDLRLIVSYPELLHEISELMWNKVLNCKFDLICAVPYTALPLSVAISLSHRIPMVMRRKEAKNYGTAKLIEGNFSAGQTCLCIDDLVTSGLSLFETIAPLTEVGLKVKDIVVLLDREQGGRKKLEQAGLKLHSVLTLNQLLSVLLEHQKIASEIFASVHSFLTSTQV